MSQPIDFVAPDDDLWQELDELATRSYGHRVADITALRDHATSRVALRAGRVVAGGLGLLVPQFFGGRPVPSACLAAGHVTPEERGGRLAQMLVDERVRVLQDQGAVVSSVWTKASAYARHLGWEAVNPVFSWSVATDELKRAFTATGLDVAHGLTADSRRLQADLAAEWNGPVRRPSWWWDWKQAKSDLTSYTLSAPDGSPAGLVSLATTRHPRHGMTLQVHDFWAVHAQAVTALFAFLGRYSTRADTIDFRRAAMPPYPSLLHHLQRYRVTTEAWHPWMIRILDVHQALRLRGWPTDLTTDITIDLAPDAENRIGQRFVLYLADGQASIEPTTRPAQVSLSPRQLAAWYAGAYRSATSAHLSGVHADSRHALARLVAATAPVEPWLPDHF